MEFTGVAEFHLKFGLRRPITRGSPRWLELCHGLLAERSAPYPYGRPIGNATAGWTARRFHAPVVDLSEGGMLVAGGGLEVGESVGVELAGPYFRLAGQAEVVHCDGQKTGLRIVSWSGQAGRVICALIAARLPVTLASRSRLERHTTQQPRPASGVPTALVGEDPLGAFSALLLEGSDEDAALAASVAYSSLAGSRFG